MKYCSVSCLQKYPSRFMPGHLVQHLIIIISNDEFYNMTSCICRKSHQIENTVRRLVAVYHWPNVR